MKFIDLQQWPAACPDSETENLIFDKDKSYAQKQAANTLAQKIEMAHEVLGTRERLWGDLIGRRKHAGLDTPGQAVDAVYRWLLSWRRGFLHRTSPDYESYEDYFLGIARGEKVSWGNT
jgi:hypothetical protein